jgi:hypothetical protein
MASPSEAFEKFSMWKDLSAPLSVTVIERDEPERMFPGRIDALDPDSLSVGIILESREFISFEVDEAEFSMEPDRVVVSRNNLEWLIFEEAI